MNIYQKGLVYGIRAFYTYIIIFNYIITNNLLKLYKYTLYLNLVMFKAVYNYTYKEVYI